MVRLACFPAGVAASPVSDIVDEAAVDEMRRAVEVVGAATEAGIYVVDERAVDHDWVGMKHCDRGDSLATASGEDQVLDDGVVALAKESYDICAHALRINRHGRQAIRVCVTADGDGLPLQCDVKLVVGAGCDGNGVAIT